MSFDKKPPRKHSLAPIALAALALLACPKATAEGREGAVETAIEAAYRECFRTFFIEGKVVTLALPFAENSERSELAQADLKVQGGGKADPGALWESIGGLLGSPDFAAYLEALSDGREKLIEFDIAARAWSTSADRFAIERMLTGRYPGLPHKPVVLSKGRGASTADVYNYLYCVGRVGIDCSGFVWHLLRGIGTAGGLDLDAVMRRESKLPRSVDPSLFVGAQYFDPRNGRTREITDRLDLMLPGDILLFRGEDGSIIHSAMVQSVDLKAGRLRYLQSTDESPEEERGVHDSLILFDPGDSGASLKDPALHWSQKRGATFAGELPPAFADDGERYRAYAESGGGIVVRLKALEKTAAKLRLRRSSPAPATSPAK
jgi:cell wall-associated NlpC family hydrolase